MGRRLDAETFARLAAEWGGAQPVDAGPREGVIVPGRVLQAMWPETPETVIPLTLTRRVELALRLDELLLRAPDPELMATYPRPASEDAPRLVRAHGLPLPRGLERQVGRLNVVLRETCGAQALVFLFASPTHGPEAADQVIAAWGGAPGPNEVLVALGVAEDRVAWRAVRAPPGQEAVRAALEAALERVHEAAVPEPLVAALRDPIEGSWRTAPGAGAIQVRARWQALGSSLLLSVLYGLVWLRGPAPRQRPT